MKPLNSNTETLSITVSGQVQGVGFRQATVRKAHALSITGWVRNLDDGSVEVLIQGSADNVDLMLSWLHHGPAHAKVTHINIDEVFINHSYSHFEIH